MRDTLLHRGPDHGGIWCSADGQTSLGHRRLAIIDLDPSANQPFLSLDGRYALTFNGEIYNYRQLRTELEGLGARFRTESDTEVLLESFRAWGEACVERLSGMFAFAIWDHRERRLFCARDRAGEKPFYWALLGDSFIFASELKALLEWPGFERQLNPVALVDFLTFGFVPEPRTIWRDAHKLPPGHCLSVECEPSGAPRVKAPWVYWDWRPTPDRRQRDWSEIIRDTLQQAAREMAVADVPLGTFLSGGVDSSSVTAALSLAGLDVAAFTIGFEDQAYDERAWAERVAARYGVKWNSRVVDAEDVEPVWERLIHHYDEPFNDYSYFPTYYVCREARKQITVALSGDGSDEMFAGYSKYQRLARMGRVQQIPGYRMGASVLRRTRRFWPAERQTRRMLGQYSAERSDMLTDMLVLGIEPERLAQISRGELARATHDYHPRDTVRALLAQLGGERVGLVDAMRYLDLKLTLAGDILVKVDRASMAVALEVRPVYLHRDLLELSARIPAARLATPSSGKQALKQAFEPWLPKDLIYRRKQGFHMPLGPWFRGALASATSAAEPALDAWIDPQFTRRLQAEHREGRENHTAVLHSLAFLQRWVRHWKPYGS
jgi:asparagine synthase (glutamine-hydrolysing)